MTPLAQPKIFAKMSTLLDDLIDSNSHRNTNHGSYGDREFTLPIIYVPEYNIRFWGLERLHPFDVGKWGRVANLLLSQWALKRREAIHFIEPNHFITDHELSVVHSDEFLHNVKHSKLTLVQVSEVCFIYLLPLSFTERHLVRPLRYQTTGTVLASLVALKEKASIQLGGGFHHCSARRPAGFCFFADITLAIRYVWNYCALQSLLMYNILIVDCDAHQGNGYAADVLRMSKEEQKHVYILDLYNNQIFPRNDPSRRAINREVLLQNSIKDDQYLQLLKFHLNAILEDDKFMPNLIIFNAGTDILQDDPLGKLAISPSGIIQRDEMVFSFAKEHNIPIVMLLSGGYQRSNANIIAHSIFNLFEANLIKPTSIAHN